MIRTALLCFTIFFTMAASLRIWFLSSRQLFFVSASGVATIQLKPYDDSNNCHADGDGNGDDYGDGDGDGEDYGDGEVIYSWICFSADLKCLRHNS